MLFTKSSPIILEPDAGASYRAIAFTDHYQLFLLVLTISGINQMDATVFHYHRGVRHGKEEER